MLENKNYVYLLPKIWRKYKTWYWEMELEKKFLIVSSNDEVKFVR